MWVGDKVYFLSDRGDRVSLFAPTRTRRRSRRRSGTTAWTSSRRAGPGAIVIEQFGRIQLYDLKTGQSASCIRLAGDIAELRPKFVSVASRLINALPQGARALFEARGEI